MWADFWHFFSRILLTLLDDNLVFSSAIEQYSFECLGCKLHIRAFNMQLACLWHASCNEINKASVTPPPSYYRLWYFDIFQGHKNWDITLNLMFSTVTIIRKSVSLVITKGPNMAMQVKAKEIVLQQCRLIKQNACKSFKFKILNVVHVIFEMF